MSSWPRKFRKSFRKMPRRESFHSKNEPQLERIKNFRPFTKTSVNSKMPTSDREHVCYFCGTREDVEVCENCHACFYCKNHSRQHRPPGSALCLPFKVDHDEIMGRVLVASKVIEEGEIVILDEAAVLAAENERLCVTCLKEAPSEKCSGCSFPVCNQECAEGDLHRISECGILARAIGRLSEGRKVDKIPELLFTAVGILRLLRAQKKCRNLKREITMLMSHNDERAHDPLFKALVSSIVTVLTSPGDGELNGDVTFDTVAHAYGVLKTNSMGYRGLDAYALYPTISLLSHSCSPNLDKLPQCGLKHGFKAQRRIRAGEQLYIRYTQTLAHRLRLRSDLARKWHFWCLCERCRDPTDLGSFLSSPLCNFAGGSGCQGCLVPRDATDHESEWKCTDCEKTVSAKEIARLDCEGEEVMRKTLKTGKGPGDILSAIKGLRETFNENYHLIVKLKVDFIFSSESLNVEQKKSKIEFCNEVLRVLDKIDPGSTRTRSSIESQLKQTHILLLTDEKKSGKLSREEFLLRMKNIVRNNIFSPA